MLRDKASVCEFRRLIEAEFHGNKKISPLQWPFLKRKYKNNALFVLRYYQYCYQNRRLFYYRRKYEKLRRRLNLRFGCYISPNCSVGEGVILPHPIGVVIGQNVEIGQRVKIYQNVTIGGKNTGDAKSGHMPKIADGCILYAGCKVLGDVRLASGTTVGANAVLTKDTVENGVYAGIPAVLKYQKEPAPEAAE